MNRLESMLASAKELTPSLFFRPSRDERLYFIKQAAPAIVVRDNRIRRRTSCDMEVLRLTFTESGGDDLLRGVLRMPEQLLQPMQLLQIGDAFYIEFSPTLPHKWRVVSFIYEAKK